MEDLRIEVLKVLAALTDEQAALVLDYARRVQEGTEDAAERGLEELLEEPA